MFLRRIRQVVQLRQLCFTFSLFLPHLINAQYPDFIPSNFTSAPLCTSNSSLTPLTVTVTIRSCSRYTECTSSDGLMNVSFIPAESHDFFQLPDFEKSDPADDAFAQLTFELASPVGYSQNVISYYYVDDNPADYDSNRWMTYPQPNPFVEIHFARSEVDSAPYGFSNVETFFLLFTPLMKPNGTHPYLQLNQSCSLIFQLNMNCCGALQPMQLAAQPYWILLLSTVTFFAASYVLVYTSMALDRFPIWRQFKESTKHSISTICGYFRLCPKQGPSKEEEEENNATDTPREFSMTPMSDDSQQRSSLSDPLLVSAESHAASEEASNAPSHPVAPRAQSISDRVMQANSWFLVLQFLIAVGNLLFLILKFTVLKKSSTDQHLTHWGSYQQIYNFWTNSSVSTLLASSAASHIAMKYQRYQNLKLSGELANPDASNTCRGLCHRGCCCNCCRTGWARFKVFWAVDIPAESLSCRNITLGILLLLSPAIITHVLPMSLLFFPFVLVAFAIMAVTVVIVYGIIRVTERTAVGALGGLRKQQQHRHHQTVVVDRSTAIGSEPSSSSLTKQCQKTSVEFPWYSLLLFRLVCTLTVILFVQTLYNYGILIWNLTNGSYWDVSHGLSTFANSYWFPAITREYSSRNSHVYLDTIKRGIYEKLRALTLFL